MRSACPFEPLWSAHIGPIERIGKGLIDRDLLGVKDGADEFTVHCGGYTLTAKPKLGQLFADSALAVQMPAPCSLVWNRRMAQSIGTHDPNNSSPDCLYYGFGLEYEGKKQGWRIFNDGTARWGGID